MDKEYLIRLTSDIYQLTLLFPKKEPLRYKMRELADKILADCLRAEMPEVKLPEAGPRAILPRAILKDLEILDSFFEVARVQNWVSPGSLLAIQQEYSKIREGLDRINREGKEAAGAEKIKENRGHEPVPRYPFSCNQERINSIRDSSSQIVGVASLAGQTSDKINDRQKGILEILKEREKVQVQEVKGVFPQVTKRTLRRDFEQMFKKGLIERMGEKNDTYYQLKPILSEER